MTRYGIISKSIKLLCLFNMLHVHVCTYAGLLWTVFFLNDAVLKYFQYIYLITQVHLL